MLSTRRISAFLFSLALLVSASASVNAVPVNVSFSSQLQDSAIFLTNNGDTFTLSFVVDNGGSNLLSQTWDQGDILGGGANGVADSGYFANYGIDDIVFSLTTDEFGVVTSASFTDLVGGDLGDNTDIFAALPDGGDVTFANAFISADSESFADLVTAADTAGAWSVSLQNPVSEPGTLALFGLGLLGFAVAARRRRHT